MLRAIVGLNLRVREKQMKTFLSAIILSGMVVIFAAGANAQHKKIGMRRAQAIASKHARGLSLKDKELEKENGKWIYSFEFKNRDGSIREVNVDALTGAVLSIEHEGLKKEAKERN